MSSSLGPVLENRGQVPPGVFSIIGMDPPAHTKLRNVISRGFTPRRIAALEDEIRGSRSTTSSRSRRATRSTSSRTSR